MTFPDQKLNSPENSPELALELAEDARRLLANMIQVKAQKLIQDVAMFGSDDDEPDGDMDANFVRDNFRVIERGLSELRMLMNTWVGPSKESVFWANKLKGDSDDD